MVCSSSVIDYSQTSSAALFVRSELNFIWRSENVRTELHSVFEFLEFRLN